MVTGGVLKRNSKVGVLLLVLVAGMGLLGVTVLAQTSTQGLTIPSGYPRLWWNADRIARARTWYQTNQFSPKTSPPEAQALDNALLYILTGNAQYCRTAIAAASSIIVNDAAANSPTAGVASDGMRWYGEHVILTYDWCHDQMTATEKSTLLNRWNTYLNNVRQHQWGNAQMYESNYNWGYMRNMIEWGITTSGENSMADLFLSDGLLNRWQNNFVPYANTSGKGGVWQEGSNYGPAVAEYTVVPFMSAALNGRSIFTETNYHHENIYYLIYATTPAPTFHRTSGGSFYELFPFADDERSLEGGFVAKAEGWGNFMLMLADYWRDEAAGQYARKWINTLNPVRARHVRALDRGSAERDFSTLPLDYYAAGPAYLYGRNRWGTQSMAWQLQLGMSNDPGHGHNDMGNFQLWRNGRWLSRESTGYSNTVAGYAGGPGVDTNNAVAHNVLLVNGTGGKADHDHASTMYTMRRLESKPQYSYAAVDLTPAFSGRATRIEREFLFIRSLDTMVVFDRMNAPTTKTFLAHFEQNPTVDQANHLVTGVNGDQTLRLTTLLPSNVTYRVVTENGPAQAAQFRLEADSAGSGQTFFLNVLQGKSTSDPNLSTSVVDNGSSYTLTLTHPTLGTATVVFEKTAATSGGSVSVGGQVFPLGAGMQTMTVGANGPTWGGTSAPAPAPKAPTNLRIIR
jgi:hypothetical protein